jgi:hypothetical protein
MIIRVFDVVKYLRIHLKKEPVFFSSCFTKRRDELKELREVHKSTKNGAAGPYSS